MTYHIVTDYQLSHFLTAKMTLKLWLSRHLLQYRIDNYPEE